MPSEYFATLAGYNAWANARLYDACETLSLPNYLGEGADRSGSLHAILNRILVGDRIWIARIEGRTPPALRFDQILYGDRIGLKIARVAEDEHIRHIVAGIAAEALQRPLEYRDARGDRCGVRLDLALAHLFNRQTHHRGRACAVLAEAMALPPPSLELIDFLRGR
jgi:uncharacterized damage-inducible protein DinB